MRDQQIGDGPAGNGSGNGQARFATHPLQSEGKLDRVIEGAVAR